MIRDALVTGFDEFLRRGALGRSRILSGVLAVGVLLVLGTGCASTPYDYSAYQAHMPRSILVLPPLNESTDANAPYSYLTTISEPLAEKGYYVFPVAVIDAFMKDNGLPNPGEMHGVSLAKIDEIIGADAVLYITIQEFGQEYILLSSNTIVAARARLVDVKSGVEFWSGSVRFVQGSGGSGNLIADAIVAVAEQIADTVTDATHDAARIANFNLINNAQRGMLVGPMHPQFGKTDEE